MVKIAVTKCEKETARRFKRTIKKYLCPKKSQSRAVPIRKAHQKSITLGEAVVVPDSDLHHVFDHDTVLAVSRAIEDLASEVREGELIATFPTFEDFLPEKKRYAGIANDVDAVRIWAAGHPPKAAGKIDYVVSHHPKLQKYWIVLFQSEKARAVLMCRQLNGAKIREEKRFVGFYSFNPYLVESIRWRFNLMSTGLNRLVKSWDNGFPLPDLNLKEIDALVGTSVKKRAELPTRRRHRQLSDEVSY